MLTLPRQCRQKLWLDCYFVYVKATSKPDLTPKFKPKYDPKPDPKPYPKLDPKLDPKTYHKLNLKT